ncbi:bifunctional nicotinamidase/pyrazinamidase [Aridibaculum aurantiacum]|uniref:bifunctional nicotinamidase/pyrazinamidase n=1 Tax=Aridibaculum aurantiacum TaxID=2810307 RepID=UPI001A95863A|nr:bifunctional nicotinamidase/pyrazinamidase [Aridibaculum aurantiacum]
MKALILVDIQNDFLPGGKLAVPHGNEIVATCNQLQQYFDVVVATQDWHPADHKSFASQHEGRAPFDVIDLDGLQQTLWPDHCVQASEGAEFSKELEMEKVEAIFRKGMESTIDSYSGFYDNGHRKTTALADYLRGKKVTDVYVVGLAADFCVYFTAKDALAEGFATFIVEDGTRPIDMAGFEAAKDDIRSKGGSIISSADVLKK